MIHQSLIYQDKFGNAAMRSVWSESAMVQRWLDLEAALAWAQGEVGIIPRRAATKIARHCTTAIVTPEAIAAWHERTGHVIVSLVKAFRDVVPDVGELFHFGPTTQDILDTGLTLVEQVERTTTACARRVTQAMSIFRKTVFHEPRI